MELCNKPLCVVVFEELQGYRFKNGERSPWESRFSPRMDPSTYLGHPTCPAVLLEAFAQKSNEVVEVVRTGEALPMRVFKIALDHLSAIAANPITTSGLADFCYNALEKIAMMEGNFDAHLDYHIRKCWASAARSWQLPESTMRRIWNLASIPHLAFGELFSSVIQISIVQRRDVPLDIAMAALGSSDAAVREAVKNNTSLPANIRVMATACSF